MQAVKVKFSGTKNLYTYRCDVPNVGEGDFVVVTAKGLMSVAKVEKIGGEEFLDSTVPWEYKWVVDKIDMEGNEARHSEREYKNPLDKYSMRGASEEEIVYSIDKNTKNV
jgi:hypothetical protein